MPKKRYIAATVIILLVTAGILAGPIMSRVETPTYHLVDKFDNIEIRHYEPQIVAEVRVSGPREQAIGEGFQLLADYIFGNNTTTESVAMTAPVQQQSQQTASQNIAMTAPVQQQSVKALADDSQQWTVRFVMPTEYNLATSLTQSLKNALVQRPRRSRHHQITPALLTKITPCELRA